MAFRTTLGRLIIVDSSVWADFFNGSPGPHVDRLERALDDEEDLGVVPFIVTEVLQGFRTDRGFRAARNVLTALPIVQPTLACHVRAARMFRSLRHEGVTVRGAIDCVIAQTCIDLGAELLSADADFERMARHTALRLCGVR